MTSFIIMLFAQSNKLTSGAVTDDAGNRDFSILRSVGGDMIAGIIFIN
ncbi:MAG: hypothetical protein ABI402_19690 [Ferruginibacter sp.]